MSLRIAVNSEFRFLTNFFCPKNGRRKSVIFGDDFRPKKNCLFGLRCQTNGDVK